jgi:hypothetical protein
MRSVTLSWSSLFAHFPLEFLGNDDAVVQRRVVLEEFAEGHRRPGHRRHDGALVDDARVQRGRLEEENELVVLAKCTATLGDTVQSSRRVGKPWCCATDSRTHSVSSGMDPGSAYLRKLRSSGRSMLTESPPSRLKLVCRPQALSATPR